LYYETVQNENKTSLAGVLYGYYKVLFKRLLNTTDIYVDW